jgi:tetratricopeptide (TPR) repeat protein
MKQPQLINVLTGVMTRWLVVIGSLLLVWTLPGCDPRNDELGLDYAQRSWEHLRARNHEKALKTAENAVATAPTSHYSWWALGSARMALGDYEAAAPAYRRACQIEPDDPDIHDHLAEALQSMEEHEAAEGQFRKAIELKPEVSEYHRSLAVSLREQDKLCEAEEAARRALELGESGKSHMTLGWVIVKQERYDEALAHFEIATEKIPAEPTIHSWTAYTLAKLERYDEAAEAYEHAFKLDPTDVRAILNKGAVFQRADRLEEAKAEYRRAIALAPDDAGGYLKLGALLEDRGHPEAALEQFRRAVEVAPDSAAAHAWRGSTLETLGRIDEAIKHHRKAWRLDCTDEWHLIRLVGALTVRGDVEKALDVLREGQDGIPEDAAYRIAISRAGLLIYLGHVEAGRRELQASLSAEDTSASDYRGRAWYWAFVGEWENALEQARKAAEMQPENALNYSVIGVVSALMGRCADAEEALRRALELSPDHETARLALAWCLVRGGDDKQAREQLAQIEEWLLSPYGSITTCYLAGLAYRELGETERSDALFQRAVERWPKHPWSEKMRELMQ